MAGLSLLTRGVGAEVKQKGHKKLDVCLEPEDYLNIQSKKFYLPPIEQKVAWNEDEEGDKLEYSPRELPLHKTYLTRKGALLLFSEELALRTKRQRKSEKALEAEDYDDFEMKTIEDLRNAVLSYGMGAKPDYQKKVILLPKGGGDAGEEEALYFNFLHRHRWPHQRNIRPGFSAKRYMSHWSRSWDDSILNTLRSKGYIWDKNLFQQNSLLPHLYRRINDDLSQPPMPYRINRNMLMSPGSLENYEFYKIRPGSSDSGRPSEDLHSEGRDSRVSLHGSIAAIARDEDDKARAVTYADLEKEQQQQVLQRLLVQSALHQQQQLIEESMSKLESKSNKDTVPSINEIDMEKAIDELVSNNSTKLIDVGEKAVYSDKNVKQKKTLVHKREKQFGKTTIPTLPPIPSTRQMQRGGSKGDGLPVITMEPPTPQQTFIRQTPQANHFDSGQSESWTSTDDTDPWQTTHIDETAILKQSTRKSSKTQSESKHSLSTKTTSGPVLAGGSHLQSSTESLGDSVSIHSGMKGNSLKGGGSLKSSLRSSTQKASGKGGGSVVRGPDGELISVGGAVRIEKESVASSIATVTDANRDGEEDSDDSGHLSDGESYPASVGTKKSRPVSLRDEQSHISVPLEPSPRSESLKSGISAANKSTKSQMEILEDHAAAVAAAILERPSTGRDLAKDAQDAAQLWAKMLSELFQPDATQPNRTKSAEEWRRRNSLDSLWSMESSLPEYEGPWPGKHRSMKPRIPRKITHKSNSAEAAVSLLRQSLRHAGVADENKKAKLESEPEPEQLETDQKSEASARSLNLEEAKADEIEPVTADVPVSDTQSVHSPTPSIKSARSTKSAKSIQEAFGGIKEGHIYHPASGGSGRGPQQSIPSERGSHDGTLDLDITHFRTDVPVARDEARKSARLMKGVPEDNKDQLKKSAEAAARVAAEEERRKAEEEEKRKQELASRKSSKSEKSKGSAGSKEATKKEFVVGVPKKEKPKKKSVSPKKETGKKKKGKKEKKDKGKDEEAPTPSEEVKDEEPEPVKEMTPVPVEEVPEPVIEKKVSPTPPPVPKEITPEPSPDGEGEEEEEEEDIDGSELSFLDEEDDDYDEDAGPGGPSRSQAKAAKRAAEAEKRRLAVERKRREREEAKRRALEEAERAEQMKREFEEDKRKREEAIRLRKEQEEEERRRMENEERERQRLQKLKEEREKREREEYKRRMEEMARKMKAEEEARRLEEERRRLEEEERRKAEEEMMAKMAEEERAEYELRKKQEEEARKLKEMMERAQRELEAKLAQEEAQRLARELARKQKELEARLMFNRSLQSEAHGYDHTQDINRAFTWSYFELLQYLGIEIPEALKHKDF